MRFSGVQRIALSSGPLAYRRKGSGTPLLLIHGWRGSSRHWQTTMDALADVRDCIAMDLPGHGETPARAGAIDGEVLARLAIETADRLGLGRFDLAGHSFGAAIGVFLAAHWPERVRKLVLVSLGTARNPLERRVLEQAHAGFSRGLALTRPWLDLARPWMGVWQPWIERLAGEPALYRTLARAFLQDLPEDDGLVREGVLEFLRADPLSALEIAIAAGSPSFLPALRKVAAPVLLISGGSDRIMPPSAVRALAELRPGSRRVELGGCGHLPMIERPGPCHRALRDFLAVGDRGPGACADP